MTDPSILMSLGSAVPPKLITLQPARWRAKLISICDLSDASEITVADSVVQSSRAWRFGLF